MTSGIIHLCKLSLIIDKGKLKKIMESKHFNRIKDFILLRTVRSKIIVTYIVFSIVILFFIHLSVTSAITKLEESLIASRLESDINYIEDLISCHQNATWNIQGDSIYYGDVKIGNGTEETAHFEPFLEHERKTRTFAYVFMLDKNAPLRYVEATPTMEGYQEGHYLRIAGSTKNPNGEHIVGTYMAKNVSDALDKTGMYSGEANVAGGLIFCLYNTLENEKGEVIGAIVVGRNITELKAQINSSVNNILAFMLVIIIISFLLTFAFMSRFVSAIGIINSYLEQIERGNIPDYLLKLKTRDEMTLIADTINKMVSSIKENSILRKRSETDALTGLPNRFAYDNYSEDIYEKLEKNPQSIAVEILDIDYFKEYNDNYGHQAGDECIEIIASQIRDVVQTHDNIFACRYGGDEFVIIYHGYSKAQVRNFLDMLKNKIIACHIQHEYSKIADYATITQGVCFAHFNPKYKIADYLKKADAQLYEIKKISRNSYGVMEIK